MERMMDEKPADSADTIKKNKFTGPRRTVANKKRVLEALQNNLGLVTPACQQAKIHRSTYYDYYNGDEEFKRQADEVLEFTLDFVESKLHKNIKAGSDRAIMFYLNNKGGSRGYTRRIKDNDGSEKKPDNKIEFEITVIEDNEKRFFELNPELKETAPDESETESDNA